MRDDHVVLDLDRPRRGLIDVSQAPMLGFKEAVQSEMSSPPETKHWLRVRPMRVDGYLALLVFAVSVDRVAASIRLVYRALSVKRLLTCTRRSKTFDGHIGIGSPAVSSSSSTA